MLNYDDKKEKILNASLKVFAKYGYSKTTMDDIAGQLGMKKNSLYYYFPNKEVLFNTLIVKEGNFLTGYLENERKKHSDTSSELRAILKKLIYYSSERADLLTIPLDIFKEIGEMMESSSNEIRQSVTKLFSSILKEGVIKGEFMPHDSDELADNITFYLNTIQFKEYHLQKNQSFEDINFIEIEKRVMYFLETAIKSIANNNNNNKNKE